MTGEDTVSILIVDDDPNLRRTLSDILNAKGYETLAAKNGGEGLIMLKERAFNLMLIDLKLPDIHGLDVLVRVKESSPFTEAIVLTGNATLEYAIEATNRGAFSFIQKPYDIDQLLMHIRHAVEKQRAEQELRRQLHEVERLNKLMVGRELKMEEMRERVRELEREVANLRSHVTP